MIKSLSLFRTVVNDDGTTTVSRKINLQEIANLLGLNLDSNGVMYAGDNPNNGFLFDITTSTTNLIIKQYINGVAYKTFQTINCASNTSYFYYDKNEKGCVFGASTNGSGSLINYGVGKYAKSDGTYGNCYVTCYGSNSIQINNVDGNYVNEGSVNPANSASMVSLAPLLYLPENAIIENFYVPAFFKQTVDSIEFLMNDDNYVASGANGTSGMRFVFKQ